MNLRNNLLTIFVLSICSSTFAQDFTTTVSGFDTIINLPEDPLNPNPFGFSGNSIGNNVEISSNTLLNVSNGSSVGTSLIVIDSTVNISGGTVGESFQTSGDSTINISGGTVGDLRVAFGSVANITEGTIGPLNVEFGAVNISGGSIGDFSQSFVGTVNISGGTVGDNFAALDGSTVNISGGTIGNFFNADFGSTINISGGTIGSDFTANSEVNIFGTEFFLNGDPLNDLILGQATGIFDLDEAGVLTGSLADGSSFEFDLIDDPNFQAIGSINSAAALTVTLVAVPEPGSGLTLATISIVLLSRRRKNAIRS